MTQRPDRPNGTLEQEQTVCVRLTEEVRLEFPDTWANRRGLMIFLRCLREAEGRPLVTYEWIADQLGYGDRRNVHNYWAEFQACGRDLGAYLRRRKKVDDEVVACCEQIWRAHPLWTPAQVHGRSGAAATGEGGDPERAEHPHGGAAGRLFGHPTGVASAGSRGAGAL